MFTGIIKEIGKVEKIRKGSDVSTLAVACKEVSRGVGVGDSVAVNGVCLTVAKAEKYRLIFEVMEETMRRSTLRDAEEGDSVNLEGSMRADGTFGGHFVQGHIDCVGTIKAIGKKGDGFSVRIALPDGFERLYVEKGSVAIDGISLTIGRVSEKSLEVYVIPHTLKITTLGSKKAGDKVNVEFDVIGKYIAKVHSPAQPKVTEKFLSDKGFI